MLWSFTTSGGAIGATLGTEDATETTGDVEIGPAMGAGMGIKTEFDVMVAGTEGKCCIIGMEGTNYGDIGAESEGAADKNPYENSLKGKTISSNTTCRVIKILPYLERHL